MLMMLCSLLKNEWLNVAKLLCISAHVVGLELAGLYILLFWAVDWGTLQPSGFLSSRYPGT